MSGELFDRRLRVELARAVKARYFETRESISIEYKNDQGLRVEFDVSKSLHHDPNKAKITIYNLAEHSRSFASQEHVLVRLYAGYGDDDPPLLFSGDVRWAPSTHEGTEWITRIEAADGARAHRHARHDKSYAPNVDARQILKDAAATMNLKIPRSIDEAKELLTQYASGFVASGPTSETLDKLLKPRGMSWSVQDGSLVVLRGSDVRPGEALLVDEDHGLVGTPAPGDPNTKKKHLLTFKTLLRPEIAPGVQVAVRSQSVSGNYRVEKLQATGDTHGADWTLSAEARAR